MKVMPADSGALQAALRESLARFAALAEAVPGPSFLLDVEGRLASTNRRWREVFGPPGPQAEGWLDRLIPEERGDIAAQWADCARQGAIFTAECRLRTADGQLRWQQCRIVPVQEGGRLLGWCGTLTDIHAARQAQQALADHERFTRDKLDNVLALIALLLPDGTFLEGNRLPFETAGLKPEDVRGQKFWETYWWSASPATQAQLQQAVQRAASGETVRYDVLLRLSPQQRIWIDFQLAPLRDAQGRITHLIPSAVDITDRKLTEQALRQSEATLNAVLEDLPAAIFIVDAAGKVLRINPHAQIIWGQPMPQPGATTEYAVFRGWWPDTGQALRAEDWTLSRTLQQQKPILGEVIAIERFDDGQRRIILNSAAPVFDRDGALLGGVAAAFDITKRYNAEQALQQSQALLHTVTETAPDPIFAKDRQGRMILANPATLRVIGRAAQEVLGRMESEWSADQPEQAAMIMATDQRIMQSGATEEVEERLQTAEGLRIYLSSKAPLRSAAGEVIGLVGISRDITERKLIEDRMQALNTELEMQVAQRTAALLSANAQLQGFTYSVAHDLRQQIRGINANASLLELELGEALPPAGQTLLQRLIASSEKLGMLVHDLLAYARLVKHKPERVPIDLTALAHEVAAMVVDRPTSRPDTRFHIAPGLTALGDLAMIRLVMENLLDNACKYAARVPHPQVEVGQEGSAFFVRDNGIGLDMQFAHKLFQPFERLHRDNEYAGTGIGLANVKRIIEKHDGQVWAQGLPGQGATFYFTLGQ